MGRRIFEGRTINWGETELKKFLILLLVGLVLLVGCEFWPWESTDLPDTALVTKIVDGDTIWVEADGVTYKVRYIGIDTPETYGGVECYGPEAKERNRELVEDKTVYLEYDVDKYDQYDRVLAYVWLTDHHNAMIFMVNYALVREGYATVATYPPNVEYINRFEQAEEWAQWDNLGLWAECI